VESGALACLVHSLIMHVTSNNLRLELQVPELPVVRAGQKDGSVVIISSHFDLVS